MIWLSAPLPGAAGYKNILLLLVAGELIELESAPGLMAFNLFFEACKDAELNDIPELEDEVLLLKAYDMTDIDDALGFMAVVSLFRAGDVTELDEDRELKEAGDVTELDEDRELKEVLSSIEGGKMIASDDSFDSNDVVTSLEAYKITDDEVLELKEVETLLKVCELAELDDDSTVLDIFTAAAAAAMWFTMEPKAIEEVVSRVLSYG